VHLRKFILLRAQTDCDKLQLEAEKGKVSHLGVVELPKLVGEDARRVIDVNMSDMFCGLMQCTVYACKS
jgi:hypothetical protein